MKDFWGKVRHERQFLARTGLSMKPCDDRLDECSSWLDSRRNKNYRKHRKTRVRKPGGGRKGILIPPQNKRFFLRCFLKSYPLFDGIGFVFEMSPSNASEHVKKLMPVLKMALKKSAGATAALFQRGG